MLEVPKVNTVLVAVNDSPAAFAAAQVAVTLATQLGAQLRVVTVIDPTPLELDGQHSDTATLAEQRDAAANTILKHVATLGEKAGLAVTTNVRTGRIASEILDEARAVTADMIILASVDRPGHAIPKVGSHTLRVLEFAPIPVLVVPDPVV